MVIAHTSIIIAPGLFKAAAENNTSLNDYFGENSFLTGNTFQ